jgi:hypothetical protein
MKLDLEVPSRIEISTTVACAYLKLKLIHFWRQFELLMVYNFSSIMKDLQLSLLQGEKQIKCVST